MIPDRAFFIEPETISGNTFSLNQTESNHAVRVLRMKVGQDITLLDGKGMGYHGRITQLDQTVFGEIIQSYPNLGENDYTLILAPAIIKRDRFEFMLEKAIELGVCEIIPVMMDRTVKNKLNMERCEKLIQSAAKQSMRSKFPMIHKPKRIKDILEMEGQKFCAMINETKTLSQCSVNKKSPIIIIVGPEGDFSDSETTLMNHASIQFFNLGDRRLRSETAAINSLSIINEILT